MKAKLHSYLITLALFTSVSHATAQSTAFTYQGQLQNNGSPTSGGYDLTFTLYTTNNAGSVFAGPVTNSAVPVSNGLFSTVIDFGPDVFSGTNCWLDISISPAGSNIFTELSPRQFIASTPYSIYAAEAGTAASANSVSAANIVGPVQMTQLPIGVLFNNQTGVSLSGTFNGNGSGLTNVSAASLTGLVADSLLSSNIARLNIPNTNLQATANLVLAAGFVVSTTNLNGGSGYIDNPLVTVTDVSGSNALITATISNGVVTSLNVQNAGIHYSTAATLTIAPPPSSAYQMFNSGNVFNGYSTFSDGSFQNFSGGTMTLNSNLNLPATTATGGIIYSAGRTLVDSFGENNFFAGLGAGNLTLTGSGANTGVGVNAIHNDTTGHHNTAVGMNALLENTTGSFNAASGQAALQANTTGNNNTANGQAALASNTTGSFNTANGQVALNNNTTASDNTADGYGALVNNTTGNDNTANGYLALQANTSGSWNAANGYLALYSNTNGNYNTANGPLAMYLNTAGIENVANGGYALYRNEMGSYNVGNGEDALHYNTTGSNNTANGFRSLYFNTNGNNNVADGGAIFFL